MFEAEFSYVCRSLRRCGVRDADVEDLAHDVFLAAHTRFSDFDATRPAKPWLFGIAFRVASHYRRRAGYQREVATAEPEGTDSAPAPDESLEAFDRKKLLQTALDTLDDDRRAVLVLHDLDGVAMQEVAAALGIPLFTGYSRLRTARAELASAVKRLSSRRGQA